MTIGEALRSTVRDVTNRPAPNDAVSDNAVLDNDVPNDAVIVGFDDSVGGRRALEWAQAHARSIGPLVVVGCRERSWQDLLPPWRLGGREPPAAGPPRDPVVDSSATPDDEPRTLIARGPAGPTLVRLARSARLLVVGSRGRGATAGSILGSTSAHCAHHATVPVVIVPAGIDPTTTISDVAIGVDGSASSVAALRWALRHAPDEAVIDIHFAWMNEPLASTLTDAERRRVREAGAGFLDAVVDRVVAEEASWHRTIRRHLSIGSPSTVLDSSGASMIVVGTRSEQGLAAMVAASPADDLTHHAHAALVLVPPPPGSREGVRDVG